MSIYNTHDIDLRTGCKHIEVVDRHGKRRTLRPGEIVADGETVRVQMMFRDSVQQGIAARTPIADAQSIRDCEDRRQASYDAMCDALNDGSAWGRDAELAGPTLAQVQAAAAGRAGYRDGQPVNDNGYAASVATLNAGSTWGR